MRFLPVCLSLGVSVFLLGGCGDDPPSAPSGASGSGGSGGSKHQGPGTCEGFSDKLESCDLLDRPLECETWPQGDVVDCMYGCFQGGSCEAVTNVNCFEVENSVTRCAAACRTFACQDGTLLPLDFQCDQLVQCAGGEDEVDCVPCPDGSPLPPSYVCDTYLDCVDGSDEANCPAPPPWQCGSGETVVGSYRCDDYVDCVDGSDEADCPTLACPAPAAPEPGKACENATAGLVACGLLEGGVVTGCEDRTQLLACAKDCVGDAACADLEKAYCANDTSDSPLQACFDKCLELPDFFPCADSTSVPSYYVCDGVPDCMDAADEVDCQLDCGDQTSVPLYSTCDGYNDCSNGLDESGCSATCPSP
jgi:hypothetical protein